MSWLFNESPVCGEIAINDRWGNDTMGKHGGFYISEEEWPSPSTFGNHKVFLIDYKIFIYIFLYLFFNFYNLFFTYFFYFFYNLFFLFFFLFLLSYFLKHF